MDCRATDFWPNGLEPNLGQCSAKYISLEGSGCNTVVDVMSRNYEVMGLNHNKCLALLVFFSFHPQSGSP